MTDPAVIRVKPTTPLAEIRSTALAALMAGRRVNVLVEQGGCRELACTVVPLLPGFQVIAADARGGGRFDHVNAAVDRGVRLAAGMLP